MQPDDISLADVLLARRRIADVATRTPLKRSLNAAKYGFASLHMKMETAQPTGAFKVRGAANAILMLPPDERARGVVTASSGNHGRAVAYVAKLLGLPAVICLSKLANPAKIENIRRLGAEVVVDGDDQDAAMVIAHEIEAERGMTYVDPFDDAGVVMGQATVGLEMLEDEPDLDAIFIQVSGGGLAGGIATAAKAINPRIKLVGVSMDRGAAMHDSLKAGRPIHVVEHKTIADALQGGISLENKYTFELCRRHLDDFVLLSEDEIAQAMRTAFYDERLVLEGAGACGFGAIARLNSEFQGANVAIICSGNNVDPQEFKRIITG